ncbi:MAG: glycosyltransferase family 39 protein [Chloroflexi bacterium]|nr:glycosyltransferase family 39 protein [Chloroflexota bacterium]
MAVHLPPVREDTPAPTPTSPARLRPGLATWGEVLLVGGLILLAALPRLVNILALDPYVDEVYAAYWAFTLFDPRDPATYLTPLREDGRPPLYFWSTLLVRPVFDNAFTAGRVAAALTGVGATVAIYGLGRTLASRLAGASAAILWAFSPFSVFFARIGWDDSLVACMTACAALGGALLVRRPGWRTAAFCGASIGLTVLTKTVGLLIAIAPLLALVVLAHPRDYRRYMHSLLIVGLTLLVVLLPLVPWIGELRRAVALHAAAATNTTSSSGLDWLAALLSLDLFRRNLDSASGWIGQYVGTPTLIVAGLSVLLLATRYRRPTLYLGSLGLCLLVVVLDRVDPLFSRYLLFAASPLYVLAGLVLAWAGSALVHPLAQRLTRACPTRPYFTAAIETVAVLAATLLLAGPTLPFTLALISAPDHAPLPPHDRFRYVEQWFALHGLRETVDYLRASAAAGPVTVLVPPHSQEQRTLQPHEALRLYLRNDDRVRFVEVPDLFRANDLCRLRRWVDADSPTFLVVNGTYTTAPGTPDDLPDYTRKLESRLSRDVPEAAMVLRIPRPTAPNWLGVYRIDRPPASDGAPARAACRSR